MTYEEAFDVLVYKIQIDVEYTEDFERDYQCLRKCAEALKKQIPKKPFSKNEISIDYVCPSCGEICGYVDSLAWEKPTFCPECGQRLDWSK